MPGLTIGDTLPNIKAESTHGKIKLHDYIGDSWAIVFSHPGDFTPVCTTELGKMAEYAMQFQERGVKLVGLSCDDVQSHLEYIKDIEALSICGRKVEFPILADPTREIIEQLNMVDPDMKDSSGNPVPSRALHIVGPDKKVKLSFLYPATTGRNMDEVLRVLESMQMASKKKIATPANWKPGEPVVITPSVSQEEAKKMFPQGYKTMDLPSKKEYLRFTTV
ncbi:1-Cys peroxiredoxin [Prunus yedoensis var. nudiflora]|uniref:Peroxiredoxin n=1 Tax=Prunus yedoensis var. nudiflora TaxID=2094558 RepID=A0A314V2J8_PRUYE|nr:1-Cys peroxiredoxin [Prunus yedoensis var. nudiflora]